MFIIGWVPRHSVLITIVIVMVVLATPIAFGLDWYFLPNRPTTSEANIESVEVHLDRFFLEDAEPGRLQLDTRVSTTDPGQIRALLDVFRGVSRAKEHKCGETGSITIHRKDGKKEVVFILPGHDEPYYEYRYQSRINRVDRQAFLAALAGMGVHGVKTQAP